MYVCIVDTIRKICSNLSLSNNYIVKGDVIIRACALACSQHSIETSTLAKDVTKHKHMQKWMVEFPRKSESRGNKIARVNSIRSKSINLL